MYMRQDFFTISGIVYGVLSVIIITFSVLVLLIVVSHWRTDFRSTANLLTCNSCAALLAYGLTLSIQVPFVIQTTNHDFDALFCQVRSLIYTGSTLAVCYSFLNMAVSCYFQTILYTHRVLLSYRMHWLLIALSWIFSALVTVGTSLVPFAYIYESESGLCVLTTKCFLGAFIATISVFVVTVSAINTLYGMIILHITRQKKMHPNTQSTAHARRNVKVFKKIFLFIGILLAGGGPFFFATILHRMGYDTWVLILVVHMAIAFGCALNSIAILWTNQQVKEILFTRLGWRQSNKVGAQQMTRYFHQQQTITVLPIVG